jgi:hypothetical protein
MRARSPLRYALAPILFLTLAITSTASAIPPGTGWTPVLQDDFDYAFEGWPPDPTKWTTCFPVVGHPEPCVNGSKTLAFFVPSEASLVVDVLPSFNGSLALSAQRCTATDGSCLRPWESGMVASKLAFLYGYFDIRWTISRVPGFHPDFWLLAADGTWPPEVDISEFKGSDPSSMFMTVHWPSATGGDAYHGGTFTGTDFSAGYHTVGLLWDAGQLVWYVDGVQRHRETQHVPQKPMYVATTLEVGPPFFDGYPSGSLSHALGATATFIHVWQQCSGCNCQVYPLP